jgi:excisionase family DNA binding protein
MTHYERIRAMLTTGQVARLLCVHVSTIRRWCECGKLKAYRIGPRGERMFRWEDVNRLLPEDKS